MICFPLDNTEYQADALGAWSGTRTRGVFSADGHFGVKSNGNMTVTVSPGIAWLKAADFWGVVVHEINPQVLTIDTADGALSRLDAICVRLDKTRNVGEIVVKKGRYMSPPPLFDGFPEQGSSFYDEIYVAAVTVRAGATSILQTDITDLRLNEYYCGLMRDGVTGIPTQSLYDSWQAWFSDFKLSSDKKFSDWYGAFTSSNATKFNNWFQNLQDQLNSNQAANLQNQIDNLTPKSIGAVPNEYGVFATDAEDSSTGFWHKMFTCKSSAYRNSNINMSLKVLQLHNGGRTPIGGTLNILLRFNSAGALEVGSARFSWESCTENIADISSHFAINIVPDSNGASVELYIYNNVRYAGYMVSVLSKSTRSSSETLTFTGNIDWSGNTKLTDLPNNGTIKYSQLGYYLAQTPSTQFWIPSGLMVKTYNSRTGRITRMGNMVRLSFVVDFTTMSPALSLALDMPYLQSEGAVGVCEIIGSSSNEHISGWLSLDNNYPAARIYVGSELFKGQSNTRYTLQGNITYYTDET